IIDLARKQIDFDHADTFKLIEGLAAANIHNIIAATGGQMKYNKQTGLFETPLGIVTADAISDARNLLSKIGTLVQA
ncbi:hypothetical protein, partial [Enterococcus faecalis]|uniref:hypothetical protein n=1 Tax=Enterococcus faecalis TaxID=1351 RepID=UPI00403F8F85